MSKWVVFCIYFITLSSVCIDFSSWFSKRLKFKIFDLLCLVLIIFSTLKPSNFCFDIENYIEFYNDILPLYSYKYKFGGFEPAYSYLNAFVKMFSNNYHFLFFVLTLLDVCLYRRIILKYSDKIFLSLFVYVSTFYFANEMVVLRFAVAAALVFLNIENLETGNIKRYIFSCVFATFFHYSAVSSLVIPFLYKSEKRETYILILIFLIVLAGCIFSVVSPIGVIVVIAERASLLYEVALWRLIRYVGIEESAGVKRIILYLIYIYIALICFLNNKNNADSCKQNIIYAQLLYILIAVLYMVTLYEFSSMSRVNQLFLTSVILISGNLNWTHKKYKYLKQIYLLGIIVLQVYVFLRQNFFNSADLILYK